MLLPDTQHRYNDDCEAGKHGALVRQLLEYDKVHFMFGSTPVFAEAESVIANNAKRLIYHCCVGPDVLYEQVAVFSRIGMKWFASFLCPGVLYKQVASYTFIGFKWCAGLSYPPPRLRVCS
jgi:hypothetical protein